LVLSGAACLPMVSEVPEVVSELFTVPSAIPSTYKVVVVPSKLAATWCQLPSLIIVIPSKLEVPP